MAFETPTLNDFVRISENGLSTAFYGESSVLRKSVLKVLARVFAGVAFLVVLLLKKMWKNVFLTTCDVETLKDFGVDFDLPNKPESFSKGFENTVAIIIVRVVRIRYLFPNSPTIRLLRKPGSPRVRLMASEWFLASSCIRRIPEGRAFWAAVLRTFRFIMV